MFDVMHGDVVSARTNADNDKMLKLRLSSPNFAKPPVVRSFYSLIFIVQVPLVGITGIGKKPIQESQI